MTDDEKVLLDYIDDHKQDLYKFLSDMLKIETQNFGSHGNEKPGQDWLMSYCQQNGYEAEMYYPDDVPGFVEHAERFPNRDSDKRPNVAVRFDGKDNSKRIMFAAHMDTELIGDESLWKHGSGTSGAIEDGKIFGRGAGDDKGGIAASLFAARAFAECGIKPEHELIVTSYADEEGGGGNGALAACLKHPSDVYVNLDSAHLEVCPWTIGGSCYKGVIRKQSLDSSSQDTFDALNVAVQHLKKFGQQLKDELAQNRVYNGTDEQHDAFRLENVNIDATLHEVANFDLGLYSLRPQKEIVAELEKITKEVNEEIKQYDCVFEGFVPITRYFHPIMTDSIPSEAKLFGDALAEVTGRDTVYAGGCMSDLSLMGNFGGGMAFNSGIFRKFHEYGGAHQVDEYIECQQLLDLTKALALFAARYKIK